MLDYQSLITECQFSASRSGGAGGQNVNKVNTKMELRFCVAASELLNDHQKEVILQKLASRITDDGELLIVSQTERTQLQNKEAAIKRFLNLITQALTPQTPRKATKPSYASKLKRVDTKRKTAEKKTLRQRPDY